MPKETQAQTAFILHRLDFSETSLILEIFSREGGRAAVLAKGARKPSSALRAVLLPFVPLALRFTARPSAEIHTLKAAEWASTHAQPRGDDLLNAFYLNELLLRLLARHDAHARVFDAYAHTLRWLAQPRSERRTSARAMLRAFELLLLRETGVLPALDVQAREAQALHSTQTYRLDAPEGLTPAAADAPGSLSGSEWLALWEALEHCAGDPLALCAHFTAPLAAALQAPLRTFITLYGNGRELRTRTLLHSLRGLRGVG